MEELQLQMDQTKQIKFITIDRMTKIRITIVRAIDGLDPNERQPLGWCSNMVENVNVSFSNSAVTVVVSKKDDVDDKLNLCLI